MRAMKPLLRNTLYGSLIVSPVLAVIAATVGAHTAVPRLLAQQVEEGAAKFPPFLQREFAAKKTPAQIAETEKRCWQQAERAMLAGGATEKEAPVIVAALHAKFNVAGNYAVPIHVRAASIWGRRVWAITLAWELRPKVEKDGMQPCRHWTVVLEADAPHRVLAEDGCG